MKKVCYGHKNKKYRSVEQDMKPKNTPGTFSHIIYDKEWKNI